MLTEKNWPPEAVMRLLLAQLVCIFIGVAVLELFFPVARYAEAERQRWAMVVGTLSFQAAGIACVAFFVKSVHATWREAFGFGADGNRAALRLGALAGVAMVPVMLALGQVSAWVLTWFGVEPELQTAVRVLQAEQPPALIAYLGVFTVAIAPLGEELIFRGVLYPTLCSVVRPATAMWGTSLFFAAIHLNAMTFLPLTLLAIVLTKLYQHTGNLAAPIVTHALFNLANFLFLVFEFDPDRF